MGKYYTLKFDGWDEERHVLPFQMPAKQVVTKEDFGGICWPDEIETYVASHTGAINSSELVAIERDDSRWPDDED